MTGDDGIPFGLPPLTTQAAARIMRSLRDDDRAAATDPGLTLVAPSPADDYESYLRSAHWRHVRELALEHYGRTCVLCNATRRLNVHHRTYGSRGHERLADLVVLCRDCHARYHHEAA